MPTLHAKDSQPAASAAQSTRKSFYREALDALQELMTKTIPARFPPGTVQVKVIGFSAYCVTGSGIFVFANRLGCVELLPKAGEPKEYMASALPQSPKHAAM